MPVATASTTLATAQLELPSSYVGDIARKVRDASVIAKLCPAEPVTYTDEKHMMFTQEPEGEFVGEGQAKSPSQYKFEPIEGKIHKFQVTVRMSEEVQWADEDARVGILDELTSSLVPALARGLDYGIIHAISPLTGAALSGETALTSSANQKTATSDSVSDIDSLPDDIVDAYEFNGVALATTYANTLRKLRVTQTGERYFPEIPLNVRNAGTIDGVTAAVSGTVQGRLLTTASNVLAIGGDWSLIRWGYVRNLGVQRIDYGDPDGLGDLKRYNQIAYRAECVYSWAIFDPKGFTVLKSATA